MKLSPYPTSPLLLVAMCDSGLPHSGQGQQRHAVSDTSAHHQGNSRTVFGGGRGPHRYQYLFFVSWLVSLFRGIVCLFFLQNVVLHSIKWLLYCTATLGVCVSLYLQRLVASFHYYTIGVALSANSVGQKQMALLKYKIQVP